MTMLGICSILRWVVIRVEVIERGADCREDGFFLPSFKWISLVIICLLSKLVFSQLGKDEPLNML